MEKEFVSWSGDFALGIPVIDEQHKELLRLTNDLYLGCLKEEDEKRLDFKDAIYRSMDYIREHFSTEEMLLEKVNYCDLEAHKNEHREFILRVLENIQSFDSGSRLAPSAFARYLRDWILNHIAISDKKYAPYLIKEAREALLEKS